MYSDLVVPFSSEQELARLQALFTALLKHRLNESLTTVAAAMARWSGGEMGPFEAHAELLKHVTRAERLAATIARSDDAGPGPVLRNAFDAGLLDAAEFEELVGAKPEDVEPAPDGDDLDVPELPPKREFVSHLLEEGPVLVHIDPRREGVSVPARLVGDPRLVLRFGYGLAPAIVDLVVDADGIAGTLTFGGVPHHCILPWAAVYAVVSESSQQAMVWPDDVPAEVLEQMTQAGGSIAAAQEGDTPEPPPAEDTPRRASHLKLVE